MLRPELAEDPAIVARFLRERAIMLSLSHPCLVRVLDLVVEGDTLAIVMDLVDGPDLRGWLREAGTLSPFSALRLTGQVLAGLHTVHSAGILHRDLKPENVLVDTTRREPVARLTDFGIAHASDETRLTNLTDLIGTPRYLAPETIEDGSVTAASDLYAAGIVLYELLCGAPPFTAPHISALLRQHLEEPPSRPDGLSDDLWAFLASLLEKDPSRRTGSAALAARQCAALASSYRDAAALSPQTQRQTEEEPETVGGGGAQPIRVADSTMFRKRPVQAETQVPDLTIFQPPKIAPNSPGVPVEGRVGASVSSRVSSASTSSNAATAPTATRVDPATSRSPFERRKPLAIFVMLAVSVATLAFSLSGALGSGDTEAPEDSMTTLQDLENFEPHVLQANERTEVIDDMAVTDLLNQHEVFKLRSQRDNHGDVFGDSDVEWFARNGLSEGTPVLDVSQGGIRGLNPEDDYRPLSYRGNPLYQIIRQPGRRIFLFSDSHSGGWDGTRYLVAGDDKDRILYAYDLKLIGGCGPGHGEPLQSVMWAVEQAGILRINADCFFADIEIKTDRLVRQNFSLSHQGPSLNFVIRAGLIITGTSILGNTEPTGGRVVAIRVEDGTLLQSFDIASPPQYLVVKDNLLYVRAKDHEYIFELMDPPFASPSPAASPSVTIFPSPTPSISPSPRGVSSPRGPATVRPIPPAPVAQPPPVPTPTGLFPVCFPNCPEPVPLQPPAPPPLSDSSCGGLCPVPSDPPPPPPAPAAP